MVPPASPCSSPQQFREGVARGGACEKGKPAGAGFGHISTKETVTFQLQKMQKMQKIGLQ